VYSKDFTIAIFYKLEIARRDSERLGVWKKILGDTERELKFFHISHGSQILYQD